MQFVKNGPDIPERLLQAHEEGGVVFFCGAGISYPAGLPGFKGLANELYRRLDVDPNPTQRAALNSDRLDTAIGLLEDDYPGRRTAVRRELAAILTPTETSAKATATHEALLTLWRWSETYRDGVRGKESIVEKEAIGNPLSATLEDDFVGRVLWALEDKTGFPARRFAELDPVPSLDWLKPLIAYRYGHDDLSRFGVSPKVDVNGKLSFSHMSRPAPYDLAPSMALVDGGVTAVQWDDRMQHLARWLTRHLDDPRLILWIAKQGGQPHERFASELKRRIEELATLECEGNSDRLNAIREAAPRAIPRQMLRALWRLLLSGCLRSHDRHFDLYQWQRQLMRDGLTPDLRLALREMLAPCIELREPFGWNTDDRDEASPAQLNEIVDWELRLRCEDVHSILHESRDSVAWLAALADLVPDLSILLRDGLDLLRELGGADDRNDSSFLHQPSIGHHPQNMGFQDWTALIELARDGWIALSQRSPEQARRP